MYENLYLSLGHTKWGTGSHTDVKTERVHPMLTSTRNQAEVAKLDAYFWNKQNGGKAHRQINKQEYF